MGIGHKNNILTGFAFYIAVRCGFDKQLYLNNCLQMHIIITHVHVCPKLVVLREKEHSSLLFMIAKHKYLPLLP